MTRILKWSVPIDNDEHQIGPGPVVFVAQDAHREPGLVYVWTQEPERHHSTRPGRFARVFGTGQPFDGWTWQHIGSVVIDPFVWHVLARTHLS